MTSEDSSFVYRRFKYDVVSIKGAGQRTRGANWGWEGGERTGKKQGFFWGGVGAGGLAPIGFWMRLLCMRLSSCSFRHDCFIRVFRSLSKRHWPKSEVGEAAPPPVH